MDHEIARTRLLIIIVVLVAVVGFLLYLRNHTNTAGDQAEQNPEIKLAVKPECILTDAPCITHDINDFIYRWIIAPDFAKISHNYKVRVQFIDGKGKILFQDDHYPPSATNDWQPGQTVEYKRLVYIPPIATRQQVQILIGLYDEYKSSTMVYLQGEMKYPGRFVAGQVLLEPPPDLKTRLEQSWVNFEDGWYPPEREAGGIQSWRWMAQHGIVILPNLHADSLLYLNCWTPRQPFERVSQVKISFNDSVLEEITADPEQFIRKYRLSESAFQGQPSGKLVIEVNQTYVPRKLGMSDDRRELGLMLTTLYYRKQIQIKQQSPLQPAP